MKHQHDHQEECVHLMLGEPTQEHYDIYARIAARLEPVPGPPDLPGPCHVWIGTTDADGFGFMKYRGERRLVHRLVAEAVCGRDLPPSVEVVQRCGQRLCMNWLHMDLMPVSTM